MITLIICVRRAAHVTHEYFESYWRDHHGPLVLGVPEFTRHIRSYRQFHLIDYHNHADDSEPSRRFDGVAILSFESAEVMQTAFQEPRFLSVLEPDTYNFGDLAHSPQFIVTCADSSEQAASFHGSITVFEFAGPTTTPALQFSTKNTLPEIKPIAVVRYKTIVPDGFDESNQPDPTYITACSFASLEEAEKILSSTEQASPSSVGQRPVHAIAREHVFL